MDELTLNNSIEISSRTIKFKSWQYFYRLMHDDDILFLSPTTPLHSLSVAQHQITLSPSCQPNSSLYVATKHHRTIPSPSPSPSPLIKIWYCLFLVQNFIVENLRLIILVLFISDTSSTKLLLLLTMSNFKLL
jgi:hypothetical protein